MAQPKRVLVLIDSWFPKVSGAPVHVWELSKELAETYGYQITILTRELPGKRSFIPVVPNHLKERLSIVRLGPRLPWENLVGRLIYLVVAFLYGLKHDVDIVHAHAFSPCGVAKILGKLKKCPVVVTVHGTRLQSSYGMGHGPLDRLYRYLEEKILLSTMYDRVISVDKRFLELRNVNNAIVVIPNGAHIPKHDRKRQVRPLVQLLFVGRLVVQKNLASLVEAMADAWQKYPRLRLIVVGDGPERKRLEGLARQRRISSYVRFTGVVREGKLSRYYGDADAFVLPSLYEGHSLSLLTACAYGLPVIATDVGANRGMVRDGMNGYLIPPGSSERLSDAILKLCKSTDRQKMGSKSRELAARYSWANTARKTHRVYQELLSQ